MKIEINQNIIIGFYKDCWRVRSRKKGWTFYLWRFGKYYLAICNFKYEGEVGWKLFGFYKDQFIWNLATAKKRENVLFNLTFGKKEFNCFKWAKKWVWEQIPEGMPTLLK